MLTGGEAVMLFLGTAMVFFILGYFIGIQQGWEDKRIDPTQYDDER